MSGRRTAVLAVLFVALATYFALFEGFTLSPAAPEWERGEKILKCDPASVKLVEISTPRAEVSGERTAEGWKTKKPVEVPGRAAQSFNDLVESLCRLPIVDRIEEVSSLADFGLDEPPIRIRVVSGERTNELLLGATTPASNLMYAKLANGREVLKVGVLLRSDVEKVLNNTKPKEPQ